MVDHKTYRHGYASIRVDKGNKNPVFIEIHGFPVSDADTALKDIKEAIRNAKLLKIRVEAKKGLK